MTAKIAKQWFRDHPRSVVVFHERMAQLPASSRDALESPRVAEVIGNRVVFSSPWSGRSELSLVKVTAERDQEILRLFAADGRHFIAYMGVK